MRYLISFLLLPLLLAGGQTPDVPKTLEVHIQEWEVPWQDTRPRDPYVDPEGRVWFVGQRGHYLAYLDPNTGQFRRYELEDGTGPHNVIVDPAGYPWYAGNLKAHIGRLDPRTGEIRQFPMPDPSIRDPHTLIFNQQGDIWFTVQGAGYVGRLKTSSEEISVYEMPRGSRPYGITLDSSGRPWFNLFGTNLIGSVDPANGTVTHHELPRSEARSRRIEATSDDAIWYVDYAAGYLGRIDAGSGAIKEWRAPSGAGSRPYAMAVDEQDRIWFVESGPQPNRLVGFDPRTESYFSTTEIPSGGGTVRHMVFHAPSNSIWFGTDTNTIGRARL